MDLHEYQARELLVEAGVPVPQATLVKTLHELNSALDTLGWQQAVVKAQVHAGGRGKAGGVKVARGREEIVKTAQGMFGKRLVTHQTGPLGAPIYGVLLSECVEIAKEYYLAITMDRKTGRVVFIASSEGGMAIEDVAKKHPDALIQVALSFNGELKPYQHLRIANKLGWKGDVAKQGKALLNAMTKLYWSSDALLLEVNPLALTRDGKLVALDAKLSIDSDALYRQGSLAAQYDTTQVPESESLAQMHGLSYISLQGNIGCVVNGAGLAMATMDLIQYCGGSPANFLDVGGGATKEKIQEGCKLLFSDPQVKVVFVNIFGGIMNCVTIAAGLVAAVGEFALTVPLVVRLAGNNVENGKKLLADSGLSIYIEDDLEKAAQKAVALAQEQGV